VIPDRAQLYYTGTTSTFDPLAPGTLLGTINAPNGAMSFNFTAAHDKNTRYYWLVYDIPAGAPDCATFDASMPTNSLHYTGAGGVCPATNTATPSTPNPSGNRMIETIGCWNYCESYATNTTYSYISNVSFNTINNTSSTCANYTDYTGISTTVMQGTSHTLTITKTNDCTGTTQYTGRFAAWIDWDNNGIFEVTEQVLAAGQNNGPASAVVNVPTGATVGATRMRCIFREGSAAPPSCGSYTNWGETEDYTINIIVAAPTCSDGIQNGSETGVDCGGPDCEPCHCTNGILDGDETGIDCGGSCDAQVCPTCSDGIQNGTETGIDCGGTDCISCTPQPTGTTTNDCSAPASVTVYCSSCDQIGTSAYNLYSPLVTFTGSSTFTPPSPLPGGGCPAIGSTGTWLHVELGPDVNQVQLQYESVNSIDPGNSTSYATAYQGTCGSLTYVDCQPALGFISGSYVIYNIQFSGLNPAEDLWIFMYNDAGKSFDLNFHAIGSCPVNAPPNTSCGTATNASGGACNHGAPGASFATPGSVGQSCSGGSWGSNENTTFYTVNVTDATATLLISDIVCNDGTAGAAQFGVWESCGDVGTYGAGFLGCAVGTASLSLTGLDPNNTYIIAADGFAGDNCKWNFSGTNLVLPIELQSLIATPIDDKVKIEWITASEINNEYFTIERSIDMENWEELMIVDGHLNSSTYIGYTEYDNEPYTGTSYYRLKQTDTDGKYTYSDAVSVNFDAGIDDIKVYPNPISADASVILRSSSSRTIDIKIYNIANQLISNTQQKINKGYNNIDIETDNLPNGFYFMIIDDDYTIQKVKFVKK
jgi:hypothetical protein